VNQKKIGKICRIPLSRTRDLVNGLRLDSNEVPTNWDDEHYKKIFNKIKNYDVTSYPKDNYTNLKFKISKNFSINSNCIHITSGADGAIKEFLLMNYSQTRKKKVLILSNTYGMYDIYLDALNYQKKEVQYLTINHKYNFCKLDKIKFVESIKTSEIIIIINPNHLSNYDFSVKEIENLIKINPKKIFFIDEAYFGYGCFTTLTLTAKYRNIYVARSFSKHFGLASIRLGCLVANKKSIKPYHGIAQPYLTNIFSSTVAEYFLDQYKIVQKKLNSIIEGRNYIANVLVNKSNFAINVSNSMSVFIDLKTKKKMNFVYEKLKMRKIYTKKIIFSTSSDKRNCIRVTCAPIKIMKYFFLQLMKINNEYR
jgi:histidinol-phosphate aminotransferase